MKFATEIIRHYPPHLRHVAALPWEIQNLNFLQIFSRCGKMHFVVQLLKHRCFSYCCCKWPENRLTVDSLHWWALSSALMLLNRKWHVKIWRKQQALAAPSLMLFSEQHSVLPSRLYVRRVFYKTFTTTLVFL